MKNIVLPLIYERFTLFEAPYMYQVNCNYSDPSKKSTRKPQIITGLLSKAKLIP